MDERRRKYLQSKELEEIKKKLEKLDEIERRLEKDIPKRLDEISFRSDKAFIFSTALTLAIFTLGFYITYYYSRTEPVIASFVIYFYLAMAVLFWILGIFYKKEQKEKKTVLIALLISLIIFAFLIKVNPIKITDIETSLLEIKEDISEFKENISNIEKQLADDKNTKVCIIYPNETSGSFYINESGCTIICPAK